MFPEFERITFNHHFLNVVRSDRVIMGFTETGFSLNDLSEYLCHTPIIELKQIHSDKIVPVSETETNPIGDGLILDSRKMVALIKTADCLPLFFWNQQYTCAGIVHCGWRGLQTGIERNLLDMLGKQGIPGETLSFFIGPGIEEKCYPVGQELYEMFRNHRYRDQVFKHRTQGGFFLDLKKALFISLTRQGISPRRIFDSKICTYCEKERFPSFRRDGKSKNRIYNFLMLR